MNEKPFALISGAASGIGRAISYELASRGRNLLLVSKTNGKLIELREDLVKKYGIHVMHLQVDLIQNDGPGKVIEWIKKNDFQVDFLINNAGLGGTIEFEASGEEYINERILLNIRAHTLLIYYLLPELRKHQRSIILNVASLSAFFSIPFKSVYSSTKAYVLHLSRALKTEIKGSGVQISVLCPNGVYTNDDIISRIEIHGRMGRLLSETPEFIAAYAIRKTESGKFIIVPGLFNRIILSVVRLLPGFIVQKKLSGIFSREMNISDETTN